MSTKMKALLNLLLFLVTLAVNALGAIGRINGLSQKVVSDRYDTLITPSPSTFSIWGVIYLLLLATLLFWLIRHKTPQTGRAVDALSPLLWLSCILNITWIVAFSYELIGLSTLFILALAVVLALMNLRMKSLGGMATRLGGLAFGLYNGWILLAAFVNVAAYLVKAQWNGFGLSLSAWAIIALATALAGALLIQLRLRNAALTLPIAWAFLGISGKHGAAGAWQGRYPEVASAALVGMAVALAIALAVFLWNKRCVLPLTREQRKG